jgi:GT2 family glycosyltransferase
MQSSLFSNEMFHSTGKKIRQKWNGHKRIVECKLAWNIWRLNKSLYFKNSVFVLKFFNYLNKVTKIIK